MLPFDIDMNALVNEGKKQAKDIEKAESQKKTSCSQQTTANQIVLGSMASNPNAGQIQQTPAAQ